MAECFHVTVGVHGEYEWLASEHCLDDLLKLCPEIVLGKYIAVTSVDSGHYFPTAKELAAGWESRSGIAYPKTFELFRMFGLKWVKTYQRTDWARQRRVQLGHLSFEHRPAQP